MREGNAISPALDRVLSPDPPPFALILRPEAGGRGRMDVLLGEVSEVDTLAEVPLHGDPALVLIPYRQIAERGYAAVDDRAPLLVLRSTSHSVEPTSEVLGRLPDRPLALSGGDFDVDDDQYAQVVRRIIDGEIGSGEGSNFVIKRTFAADVAGYDVGVALAFFKRLCERESGAYWTFIVHTPERTLVGATPERHVSLRSGVATMNPISGTYRYPATGPSLRGVLDFLGDVKERDELHMVVDEELKMMARLCADGARVDGPYLKEMARLAHTEYFIRGHSACDPREILRETLFAPTVTGSPLESACRVIARHEPEGRAYYGGVAALVGLDDQGHSYVDSAILIRTADISPQGRLRISVGSTLVRHSSPEAEAAEGRAKAAGLLSSFDPPGGLIGAGPRGALRVGSAVRVPLGDHPLVRMALERRRTGLAHFWLSKPESIGHVEPGWDRLRILIVDAEDTFTEMIAHQLRSLGPAVDVRRFDQDHSFDGYDLVVMGPGPGDPSDDDDPRIAHMHASMGRLLREQRPFVAVCLSHQVLSRHLGLELSRCKDSNQGRQRKIDLFGEPELVGFYNTFAAHTTEDKIDPWGIGAVEVCRDQATGEVFALRGQRFASMQFHAESVLTQEGPRILAARIREVLGI